MVLMLAGGAIGLALAVYGAVGLIRTRGRHDPGKRRMALYTLSFGAAVFLLGLAGLLNHRHLPIVALPLLAVSMALVGLAVFRYRPNRS
jgi:hypothetical protein